MVWLPLIIWRILLVSWHVHNGIAITEMAFSKQTACKLDNRLSTQCAHLQDTRFKSLIQCGFQCAKDDVCLGISVDGKSSCYKHQKCAQNFTCGAMDSMFTIYIKESNSQAEHSTTSLPTTVPTCLNDGILNTTTNVCICTGGWVGKICERYGKTCKELAQNGYPQGWPAGLIWAVLQFDINHPPIKVLCELRETYFNTYIMRNNGWTYQKSYKLQDYINGFNTSGNCFWLGLTNMKRLNDVGHTTVQIDTGFTTTDFNLFQAAYENFSLGDSSTGFKFTYSKSVIKQDGPESKTMTYGNCLEPLKDAAKFAAPDAGYDNNGKTCAQKTGTGWWFKDCNISCNPLGYKTKMDASKSKIERIIMDGTKCEDNETCVISMYFVSF